MADKKEKHDDLKNEKKFSFGDKIGCAIMLILVGCGLYINHTEDTEQNSTLHNSNNSPINKDYITKTTFNGEWAFKADSVELYCEKINDNLTGAKVKINGNTYAITRNLEHKYTFLPYTEWADAKMEGLLCEGVYMDKQCKVYLTDTVNFTDTLCD